MLVNHSSTKPDRQGFSLIEMLAVLTLVSLVTVTVTIRWSAIYRRAKFQSETEQVIDADFKTRRHATLRNRICRLVFDLDAQSFASSRWVEGRERFVSSYFESGSRVKSIRSVQGTVVSGTQAITVSNTGASPTYAVELAQDTKSRWILFAGRTGQSKILENADEIDAIFKAMRLQGISQ